MKGKTLFLICIIGILVLLNGCTGNISQADLNLTVQAVIKQTEQAEEADNLIKTHVAATIEAAIALTNQAELSNKKIEEVVEEASKPEANQEAKAAATLTFTPTPEPTNTEIPTATETPSPSPTPSATPTRYASPTGVISSGDACDQQGCHSVTFKNKTDQDATLKLEGPGSYFFTIPPGSWVFKVLPGRYLMKLDIPACNEHEEFYHTLNTKWFYDIKCP